MSEITFVVLKIADLGLHRFAYCGERAIDADHCVTPCGHGAVFRFQMSKRGVDIDAGALVIEMHTNVGIALCRFDNRGVERCASDRIDTFFRIDIVGLKCSSPDLS